MDNTMVLYAPPETQRRLGRRIRVRGRGLGVVAVEGDGVLLREDAVIDAPCRFCGMPVLALEQGVYVLGEGGWWHRQSFEAERFVGERGGNELPSLLRSWFGPDAGLPAAPNHYVRFTRRQDGRWHVTPEPQGSSRVPCEVEGTTFVLRVKVNTASGRPILLPLDRKKCPGTPMGDTPVLVYAEPWVFGFRKVAVNTAWSAR